MLLILWNNHLQQIESNLKMSQLFLKHLHRDLFSPLYDEVGPRHDAYYKEMGWMLQARLSTSLHQLADKSYLWRKSPLLCKYSLLVLLSTHISFVKNFFSLFCAVVPRNSYKLCLTFLPPSFPPSNHGNEWAWVSSRTNSEYTTFWALQGVLSLMI